MPALVKIARLAIDAGVTPDPAELRQHLGLGATRPLVDSGVAIAAAGNRIANIADIDTRRRLRGAILERLVHDLVSERAAPLREVDIAIDPAGHSGRGWTKPKELVVDANPFEVYECKTSAHGIDQDDIDELADIAGKADAEGVESRPTLAVLSSEKVLRAHRAALRIWRPIYFSDLDDLVELRFGPATQKLT